MIKETIGDMLNFTSTSWGPISGNSKSWYAAAGSGTVLTIACTIHQESLPSSPLRAHAQDQNPQLPLVFPITVALCRLPSALAGPRLRSQPVGLCLKKIEPLLVCQNHGSFDLTSWNRPVFFQQPILLFWGNQSKTMFLIETNSPNSISPGTD